MAFPQTMLPVAVAIAPGADPVDPLTHNFTDISADAREASAITIQAGRQDEASLVGPTSAALSVDNRSGNYCRTNPLGQWYGQLEKGTPLRVAVTRINDAFGRTVGSGLGTDPVSGLSWTAASSFSTNGSAAQCALAAANTASFAYLTEAVGADVEVTTVASLSAVTTGAAWAHVTLLRMVDTNNHYRIHLEYGTGGSLNAKIAKVVGGIVTDLFATAPTGDTYLAGTRVRTKARITGNVILFRAWIDGNTEPNNWDATATDDSLTAAGMVGVYEWRVAGNTNAGTLTCTFDDFRADVIRSTTPVPEWPVRWDQSGNNVISPIAGAGILRRLGQGQPALHSPMYRRITGLSTLRGYWPGEDGSGATVMSSAYPGGAAATVTDVSFGAADGPAGSDKLLTIGSNGLLQGTFPSGIDSSGWQIQWTTNLTGADVTERQTFAWRTSNGYVWVWRASTTTYRILVFDGDGNTLLSSGTTNGGIGPGSNIVFRMKCSKSGSTWTVEPGWYKEDTGFLVGFTDTFVGTAGAPRTWITGANTVMVGAFFGHLFATTGVSESLQSYDMLSAINGYPGEPAGARLVRLSAEENVPLRVFGDPNATALMGAQRPATYLDLARECEDADQGTLVEAGAGLGYETRKFRYAQASLSASPVMVLDFTSGHIAAPPEPTDDDQRLRNRIVLTRTGGGSATAEDPASIGKSGVYSDEVTVNLGFQGDLDDHAFWRLHLGTLDGLRWPRIQLQLHRNPSLIKDWCKVQPGSRITIANPPDQVGTDALDLIVEGWTEVLDTYTWDVELVCSPASAWQVGIYGDPNYRYDSSSTTLEAGISSGATLVGLSTVILDDCLSSNTPYNIRAGGEEITVLTMSLPSSVAVVDGGFETGSVGTWSPTGGTLVASSAQAHRGTWSALLTVSGSPANALIRDHTTVAASSGQAFTAFIWVRCSVSRNVLAVIDFYNGASYISSAFTTTAVAANTWTLITTSGTAPATTTRLEYGPTMDSSPANGTQLWIDDLDTIRTDIVSGRQLATVTRAVNAITKAHSSGEAVHLVRRIPYAL